VHDWVYKPIGEICKTTSGGTPSRSNPSFYDNGTIPWVKTGELINKYLFDTEEKITQHAIQKSSAKIIPHNAVVMAMYGATIGKTSIIKKDMATNQACCAMITDEVETHHEFLYYILSFIKDDIIALGAGGAQPNISQQVIRNINIPVPPISEQRKIADILTSVDNAISKTEAIIEQTEKVKKGLMQQLLTKGIGHTKFKQTEIGEIPEYWEVRPLEDVCSKIFVGIATSTTGSYTSDGVPLIRNQNIHEDKLVSDDLLQITREFSEQNKSKKLLEGDVITVRTGYPGVSCVVTKEFEGCHTFTTLISRPLFEVLNPYFLSRYINSEEGKRFVLGGKAGGAQQNLNVAIMKRLPVPIPSLNEQQKIVSIIDSIDSKITIENQKLSQHQFLKKALMQVLLTGKVRVKIDEAEAVNT
jgi:type I restriction enzyme S subunit